MKIILASLLAAGLSLFALPAQAEEGGLFEGLNGYVFVGYSGSLDSQDINGDRRYILDVEEGLLWKAAGYVPYGKNATLFGEFEGISGVQGDRIYEFAKSRTEVGLDFTLDEGPGLRLAGGLICELDNCQSRIYMGIVQRFKRQ